MNAQAWPEYVDTVPGVFAIDQADARHVEQTDRRQIWAIIASLILAFGGLAWFAAANWLSPFAAANWLYP